MNKRNLPKEGNGVPSVGTLYWYYNSRIVMLIKTQKLTSEEKKGYFINENYKHQLLDWKGRLCVITSATEVLEKDNIWKQYFERIEL